jgi:ribosomal protein L11 methyltransferase
MENWKKITVKTDKKNYELAVYHLNKISNGLEEEEKKKYTYLIAYVKINSKKIDNLIKILKSLNINIKVEDYKYDKKIETNWKKYFKTKKISSSFIIKPSWEKSKFNESYLTITLDPGNAFGTGLHGTTKGVLKILEKQSIKNKTVLDCGTGSGILSIASKKLGAKKVFAFDIDKEAIETAKENFKINKVSVRSKESKIKDIKENYDIVLANILSSILLKNKKFIIARLKKDGILILSGILIKEENKFIKNFTKQTKLKLLEKKHIDEWTTILLKN